MSLQSQPSPEQSDSSRSPSERGLRARISDLIEHWRTRRHGFGDENSDEEMWREDQDSACADELEFVLRNVP